MIKKSTLAAVDELITHYEVLSICKNDLIKAVKIICECYYAKHKLIICGNGGNAADSEHIVGELMKGFLLPRKLKQNICNKIKHIYPNDADYFLDNLQGTLPAVSLVNQIALNTAFANDQKPDLSFAQQVIGIGNKGDILLGLSTSGNSTNVIYAIKIAKVKDIKTIVLTGKTGGKLNDIADVCIRIPEVETFRIQELQLPIYHMFCIAAENEFFGNNN